MPMLVSSKRPDKAIALIGGDGIPFLQQPGHAQYPIYTARADGYQIGIQHHKGKASVTLSRMKPIVVDDRLLLPFFQPIITWDPAVVFVDLPITLAPVIKLTGADLEPMNKIVGGNFGFATPSADKVNHLIPRIVGNPSGI